jgi:hypothetical protein
MKQALNPDLVWEKIRHFPYEEHWVFLRDPKDIGLNQEVRIGLIEVEVVAEDPASVERLLQQLRETDTALSALSGNPRGVEPHILLTHDCFGFQGPVRLLISSGRPFAETDAS